MNSAKENKKSIPKSTIIEIIVYNLTGIIPIIAILYLMLYPNIDKNGIDVKIDAIIALASIDVLLYSVISKKIYHHVHQKAKNDTQYEDKWKFLFSPLLIVVLAMAVSISIVIVAKTDFDSNIVRWISLGVLFVSIVLELITFTMEQIRLSQKLE